MRTTWTGIAALTATMLLASPGGAVTVTNLGNVPSSWSSVDPSQTLALPPGSSWDAVNGPPSTRMGSNIPFYRSPFDPSDTGSPGLPNWQTIPYWAVGPNNPVNPSFLNFSTDQTQLQFLWGSVDDYNHLDFYDNGVLVAGGQITGAMVAGAQMAAGASLVRITDIVFDRVRFYSDGQNAFEFSNIAVPLPPALLLLFSALIGLGLFSRQKQQAA